MSTLTVHFTKSGEGEGRRHVGELVEVRNTCGLRNTLNGLAVCGLFGWGTPVKKTVKYTGSDTISNITVKSHKAFKLRSLENQSATHTGQEVRVQVTLGRFHYSLRVLFDESNDGKLSRVLVKLTLRDVDSSNNTMRFHLETLDLLTPGHVQ